MDKKLFYITAAMLALRAKYWADKSKENYDEMALGMSCAYDNAFNMLEYTTTENWDCLRQFGWSDEAEDLIEKVGTDISLWDLETMIKGGE